MIHSYTTLIDFLNNHKSKEKDKNDIITHTRIGDKKSNIYGGSYNISYNDLPEFYKLYYKHVFEKKKLEYLTEAQQTDGPICVDFDFRYDSTILERQHTQDHIMDIICLYQEKIRELVDFKPTKDKPVSFYIFQKPNTNTSDVTKTKDGIHMIIGIDMQRSLQIILRKKVLEDIGAVWNDLEDKLINNWDSVLDDGITNGGTNWQLYGSRKPNNEAYKLTNIINMTYDENDGDLEWDIQDIKDFDIKNNFSKLSVQYRGHPRYTIKDEILEEFNNLDENRKKRLNKKNIGNIKVKDNTKNSEQQLINYSEINSEEILNKSIEQLHESLKERPDDYYLKELHEYTMILPESYYGPGSFDKWIRVGWALRNTDFKLFTTWLKLSSKSSEFDWNTSPSDCWDRWTGMCRDKDGLTKRSVLYWAKNENPIEYDIIRLNNVNHYVSESINSPTEYNLALVLYHYYKDSYVCVNITNKIWYEYRGHKWHQIDQGYTLRNHLSESIYKLYTTKVSEITDKLPSIDDGSDEYLAHSKNSRKISDIATKFRKTTDKANIMKEALDLFYHNDFLELLDSKDNLLCFENGVVDFENKIFRPGRPEDYNSKSTKIKYTPINPNRDKDIIHSINTFITQLFPDESLQKYMWEHLASVLIGKNENQTFNIYTGAGSNGKSKIVELMSMILGDYKGTVPITLITQKRGQIGGTSSEVAQLKGIRYAVMQEASKGDVINEGILKELTGGDPLQARALYKDSITFIPQFKLVCTLNNLPDIRSNDNGTWRRIRICDFVSLFCENPVDDDPDKPHQFKIDKHLDKKFKEWCGIFMAMLVDKAFATQGVVEDCPVVMAASDNYRNEQDHISQFIKEMIVISTGDNIKKAEILDEFTQWFKREHGNGKQIPLMTDLYKQLDKKFGKAVRSQYKNVKLLYSDEYDEPDVNEC